MKKVRSNKTGELLRLYTLYHKAGIYTNVTADEALDKYDSGLWYDVTDYENHLDKLENGIENLCIKRKVHYDSFNPITLDEIGIPQKKRRKKNATNIKNNE